MGVRRTISSSGTLGIGTTVIPLIPSSNKKWLIERLYLSYSTSATSTQRVINFNIESAININISWSIFTYSTSTVSTTFKFGLANHPLDSSYFTGLVSSTYPLILTPLDYLNISLNAGSSSTDTYVLFIEYLEMDLDEEIWQ